MYASSSQLASSTTTLASAVPPSVIGATNAATSNGSALTLSLPVGTLVDDLLVAVVSHRMGTSGVITGPPGWTALTQFAQVTTLAERVFYKRAQSGDLSITHTFTFNSVATKGAAAMLAIRGIRAPELSVVGQVVASAQTIAVPGLTLAAGDAFLVVAVSKATSDAHSTASGFTFNAQATAASGGSAATANRASLQYRLWTQANPPSTTVAAGTTSTATIGVQLAFPVGVTQTEQFSAMPAVLTVSGVAASLPTTPYLETLEPIAYDLVGPPLTTDLGSIWQLIETVSGTAAAYSDTPVAEGTTYRYRVIAANPSGETISNIATATTISGSTFDIVASAGAWTVSAGIGAILVSEGLTAASGTHVLTGHAITLDEQALVFEVVDIVGPTTESYSDFGLDPSTWYVYRIAAVNENGDQFSNTDIVQTLAASASDFPMTASPGNATLAGAVLLTEQRMPASAGTLVVTGRLANFANVNQVNAVAGAFTFMPADSVFQATTAIAALRGTLTTTGVTAALERGFRGQQSAPMADVTDGLWTPSSGPDLYATIDEEHDDAPVDSDYMRTITPVTDTAVVALEPLQPPPVGEVQILVRARRGAG